MPQQSHKLLSVLTQSHPFALFDAERTEWGEVRLIQCHGNLIVLQARERPSTEWEDVLVFAITNDTLSWGVIPRSKD